MKGSITVFFHFLGYFLSMILTILIISSLLGCGTKPASVRFESFRERAVRLMAAGEYARAVDEFRKALKIDDKDYRIYRGMAECFEYLGVADSAITYYEGAIVFKPGDSDAYQSIAEIYFKRQEYHEAMAWYDRAQQIGYLTPESYINLAQVHQNWGEYDRASQYYYMAVAIDSANSEGYYGLGITHLMIADTAAAITHFLKAVDLGPQARAAFRLGLIHAERKNYDEAIKYLDLCEKLEPDSDLGRQAYQRRIDIIMKMKSGQE